ncbi:MAG: hypothetical protein JWN14_400 [Chthonomonadales bacterium]|nr:hypothetical protein [Chthonomonadales bacterium]
MNPMLHEIGWRSAIYCFFVGAVSLFSMLILIRQTAQERQAQIKAELSQAMRADLEEEDDPADVLHMGSFRPNTLLSRYLLIVAHAMVIVGSVLIGLPSMKSASYAHQGNMAYDAHDYETSVKRYYSALEASPYANLLMTRYQESLAQSDSKGGEIGNLRRLVTLHPGDQGNHNDLGNQLMQHGDMENAVKEYKIAVALNPSDAIVHNNLGNALQAAHRYPESIVELRKALQLDPNQTPTYYNLANTLMANKQVDEAIKYYNVALKRDPKLAPAYYNLAQAFAQQGRRDMAMTTMDSFLQIAPRQPEFADAVIKAKAQIADWRKIQ